MFNKNERSTFHYWFAHWCAFQMTALNLHVWKPKYLLHDIEKPWLMLLLKDYKKVQKYHREHNNHHIEYAEAQYIKNLGKRTTDSIQKYIGKIDVVAMIIDNECSRFTKENNPLTAIQFAQNELNSINKNSPYIEFYENYIVIAKKLGLKE